MMRNADAAEPLTADRKRGFMDAAITQLAEADIAPTAYFTDEPEPDAEDDALIGGYFLSGRGGIWGR